MKRVKFLFLLIIIGGGLVFIGYLHKKTPDTLFCFLDIGTHHNPPEMIEVHASQTIGQSFVSHFDHLYRMSVFIPNQNLNRNQTLYFHLKNKQSPDTRDLVTLTWKFHEIHPPKNDFYAVPIDAEIVKEGFHFSFQFPPIHDSKNKEYYVTFEAPNTPPKEGIQIGVWTKWHHSKYYEALTQGTLYKNHLSIEGALAFRTFHTFQGSLSQVVSDIKMLLLKDRAFLIIYVAVLALTILALFIFILLARTDRNEQ